MIELRQGDLLDSGADALVNTVNCVGVMGKGIALQFKRAFPDNYRAYRRACRQGEVQPGRMFVHETGSVAPPRFVINFPTKRHWRGKSKLSDIRAGLDALVGEVQSRGIRSVALPPLGCGHGGLKWDDVYPLIDVALRPLGDVQVFVYAPAAQGTAANGPAAAPPKLTRGRAMLLALMSRYGEYGYPLTALVVQRLAYLLQDAGEHLGLRFVRKHKFAPFAPALRSFLERFEGHFLHSDGRFPDRMTVELLPGAAEAAAGMVTGHPEVAARVERICRLIDGFETPFGLELLASVLWVIRHDLWAAADVNVVVERIQTWNARKRKLFQSDDIEKAWRRLKAEEWFAVAQPA